MAKKPWYSNDLLTAKIQSNLKRANQRIAILTKDFGEDSSVWKHEVGVLQKGPWKDYLSRSVAGKKRGTRSRGTSVSKGGNLKFDVRSINQAVRSGKMSRSALNRLLIQAAGIFVDKDGEVHEIEGGGIRSETEILKEAASKFEDWDSETSTKTKKGKIEVTEELAEFSESINIVYKEAKEWAGEEEMRQDETTRELWAENRNGKLKYSDLKKIKKRLQELTDNAKASAFAVEENYNEPF